ncbi:hypothetical protein GGI43DRAFT_403532 [Trichoderma evansii]
MFGDCRSFTVAIRRSSFLFFFFFFLESARPLCGTSTGPCSLVRAPFYRQSSRFHFHARSRSWGPTAAITPLERRMMLLREEVHAGAEFQGMWCDNRALRWINF